MNSLNRVQVVHSRSVQQAYRCTEHAKVGKIGYKGSFGERLLKRIPIFGVIFG